MKRFKNIRRFALGWILLVIVLAGGLLGQSQQLDSAYKRAVPDSGGVFSEGIVGELSNFNPIYASKDANQAAARLIFSSLFKYDKSGQLTSDAAESISQSKDGKTFTVKLKDNVYWHDGSQLTAEDVVFTYKTIQNPDTRSPLAESWRDIEISEKDSLTVKFVLPNSYAPFKHLLVTGIVPEHILSQLEPAEIRNAQFNQAPVGSGPFKFNGLDVEKGQLELSSNSEYYDGTPYLNRFIIVTFPDQESLDQSFDAGELTAVADVSTAKERSATDYQERTLPLSNAVFSFFNTKRSPLNSSEVRQSLALATDRSEIADELGLKEGLVYSPILPEHLKKKDSLKQKESLKQANQILANAGWKKGKDGIRRKGKTKLTFTLVSQRENELPIVADMLKEQWRKAGAEVNVELYTLERLRNDKIVPHDYDALLFGISIGGDPDVFAYWHSSQVGEGGFNFSNYSSQIVDESLEAGRTRLDNKLRNVKYETFAKQWLKDTPAVPLYRTGLRYYISQKVSGFDVTRIVDPADRFNNVNDWAINTTEEIRLQPR